MSPAFLPWRIEAGLELACGISTEVKSDPVSPGDFPLCKVVEGGFGGLGGSESVVHPACSFPRRSKQLLGREKSHFQMWIRHTVQTHGSHVQCHGMELLGFSPWQSLSPL